MGSLRSAVRALSSAPRAPPAISGILHICGTAEGHKLGLGDLQDREVPVPVSGLDGVRMAHVACGKHHSAAVAVDGDVYAWGLGSSGQLGLGSSRTKAHTPAKVSLLKPRHLPALLAEGLAGCAPDAPAKLVAPGAHGRCAPRRADCLRRRSMHFPASESASSRAARITRSR